MTEFNWPHCCRPHPEREHIPRYKWVLEGERPVLAFVLNAAESGPRGESIDTEAIAPLTVWITRVQAETRATIADTYTADKDVETILAALEAGKSVTARLEEETTIHVLQPLMYVSEADEKAVMFAQNNFHNLGVTTITAIITADAVTVERTNKEWADQ